jgi:hypothetical protein
MELFQEKDEVNGILVNNGFAHRLNGRYVTPNKIRMTLIRRTRVGGCEMTMTVDVNVSSASKFSAKFPFQSPFVRRYVSPVRATRKCEHKILTRQIFFGPGEKIMSSNVNSAAARPSSHRLQRHGTTPLTSCLVCRVLWPQTIQHRHLPLDDSSEAKTAAHSTMPVANPSFLG